MSSRLASFWFKASETILLALVFVLPLAFYLQTYDSVTVKSTTFQIGLLALASAWFLKGLERGRWEVPERAWPLLTPALALLAWTLVRFFASPYRIAALPGFLEQVLYIATYCIVLLEFGGLEHARRFARWLTAACWASGLYGLSQAFGFDPFIWKGAFGSRIFSTFGNPESFATFIAFCLPLVLTRLTDPERERRWRISDLVLVLLLGADVVLTGSAKGLAAFALSGGVSAVFLILFSPARLRVEAAALAGALVVGAVLAAFQFNGPVLEKELAFGVAFDRYTWSASLRMIAEKPWTGHGPGSFWVHYPRFRPPEVIQLEGRHNTMTAHADSQLLETAAELGWVGVGLWLWLFGSVIVAAWDARKALLRGGALGDDLYLSGLAAAVAAALLTGLFGLGLAVLIPGWLLWPAAGLAAGLTLAARPNGSVSVLPVPLTGRERKWVYAPSAIAVLMLAGFPAGWFVSDMEHNQAVASAKSHQWNDAIEHWDRVLPGADAYVMAQYFKGNVLLETPGRAEEALKQYAYLESLAPDYVQLHYQLGLAYAKIGDWENAVRSHQRQAKLDPINAQNYRRLADAAKSLGDMHTARRAALAAIALEPKESSHWWALSEIYLKERRIAASRKMQRQAARLRAAPRPTGS